MCSQDWAEASARPCGRFGLTVPNPEVLLGVEKKVGCTFGAVRWFQEWNQPFNVSYARQLGKRRLDISWQPRMRGRDGQYRGVPYRDIVTGKHHAYIRKFARDVRAFGRPVAITFAPEMNGDWGVYQLGPKNTPADFKRAWRTIVNIFRQEKAPVRFVFSPNIIYPTMKSTYRELYPGDMYVDEVGLDGYNWGTTNPWNVWKSFDETFGPSYVALKAVTNRPMQLGELSSVEKGGNKAEWIIDACRKLPSYGRVRWSFWFHVADPKVDWRLTTSQASLRAFRRCVGTG